MPIQFAGRASKFDIINASEKISKTDGKLIEILDQEIPENILQLLDSTFEYMINNEPADAVYDNQPSITYGYGKETVYRRWNMHHAPDYVTWRFPEFEILDEYFLKWASNIFNFKFIMSSPQTEIVWHEQHRTPRIHIPLQNDNTIFDIMDENGLVHSVKLERGKLYALNVCFPHRVRNLGILMRKQAFFECDKVQL